MKQNKIVFENILEVKDERFLFGLDYSPSHIYKYDLTLSENPLSCSKTVADVFARNANIVHHYPDKGSSVLKECIYDCLGIPAKNVYIGAGVTEVLQNLVKVLVKAGNNIVMPEATFPGPAFGATVMGGYARRVKMKEDLSIDFDGIISAINPDTRAVFICNPNNPTGILESPEKIIDLAKKVNVQVLVSEANIEFSGGSLLGGDLPPNLVVMRSFSKAYGLAGMRVGYAVCNEFLIDRLYTHSHPYRTSNIGEFAAVAAMQDTAHLNQSIALMDIERAYLTDALTNLGFFCVQSKSNTFVACPPTKWQDSTLLVNALHKRDCSVLDCTGFGSLAGKYIRVSPRTREINSSFIDILKHLSE